VGGNTRDGSTPFSRITKPLEISDYRAATGGAVALPRVSLRTVLGQLCGRARFRATLSGRATPFVRVRSMSERLRDADYVAERLGVPRSWVYSAARRGVLPSVHCGRYRRFAESDIERWIEDQREVSETAKRESHHEL
jgi:excisionase family DNA binding protein